MQRTSIVAIVRKLVPAGVPEHVWVDAEWHLGGLAEALNEPVDRKQPKMREIYSRLFVIDDHDVA